MGSRYGLFYCNFEYAFISATLCFHSDLPEEIWKYLMMTGCGNLTEVKYKCLLKKTFLWANGS